jgi:hypothetical protein
VRWVLIDLLLALLALGGLGVVVLGLWRRVKELGREVTRAGEAIGTATENLAEAQAARTNDGPTGSQRLQDPRAGAT